MAGLGGRFSRRLLLVCGAAAARMVAAETKGTEFPPDVKRYADAATELEVDRLTAPSYSSTLTAWYNRSITRAGSDLLFCCDRTGSPQAFLMSLKNAGTRQLTEAEGLDGGSLALGAGDRGFAFFAGRGLYVSLLATLREREVYRIAEGWERGSGANVDRDGNHAYFIERHADGARLRSVALSSGRARTVLEGTFPMSQPIARPGRPQVLYRQGEESLWLADTEGRSNRRLKLAEGRIAANWSPDGKTVLYLNFPSDPTQLNAIRELVPEGDSDRLVARTSQFVHFGFNRDTSVFAGASRNAASPTVLILLRVARGGN